MKEKNNERAPIKIHQRHLLKSKDKKKFIAELKKIIPSETIESLNLSKRSIEWIKIDNHEALYAIDGTLAFWKREGKYIPLLSFLLKYPIPMKNVGIDTGAIKFIVNGADVMRPGITSIDPDIKKGDIVAIRDPNHNKIIAVGEALYDAEEIEKMEKGKVIKNIHTLNDSLWSLSKQL